MIHTVEKQEIVTSSYVVVRDIHRQQIFHEKTDYDEFLEQTKKNVDKFGCDLHAYALLPKHVYLLISINRFAGASRVIGSIQQNFSEYFNYRYRRTTKLLELRYHAKSICPLSNILGYYRYVESAPVRSRLTRHPAEYPWSSFGCNAMGEDCGMISPHRAYQSLGNDSQARWRGYRALFGELNPAAECQYRGEVKSNWISAVLFKTMSSFRL